jgi:dTDP-L-rhamnose 4-epimerase
VATRVDLRPEVLTVTALVTGGAGLIGSHIVDALLARGEQVRVLDSLHPQTHRAGKPDWIPDEVHFVEGDVRDTEAVRKALRGVDTIFHQAAFGGFTADIGEYFDANVTGTARLFEVIAEERLPIRKIVVASSQAIYGEGLYHCREDGEAQPDMRPLERFLSQRWEAVCPTCGGELDGARTHENVRWNGRTPYAVSKLAEERLALGMGRQLGIPTVALRYAVTFGPRQSIFNPYTGVVSIFSTRLLNDLPPLVYEDGHQTRDFVFVEDVARANLLVMDDSRADGGVFNVGRGEPVTVIHLVAALAAAWGLPAAYELSGEFRPGDVRHLVTDATAIRALGWQPEVTLEDGLRRAVAWMRDLGPLDEYLSEALRPLRDQGIVLKSGAK